eukprot:tig00001415_g8668.t1
MEPPPIESSDTMHALVQLQALLRGAAGKLQTRGLYRSASASSLDSSSKENREPGLRISGEPDSPEAFAIRTRSSEVSTATPESAVVPHEITGDPPTPDLGARARPEGAAWEGVTTPSPLVRRVGGGLRATRSWEAPIPEAPEASAAGASPWADTPPPRMPPARFRDDGSGGLGALFLGRRPSTPAPPPRPPRPGQPGGPLAAAASPEVAPPEHFAPRSPFHSPRSPRPPAPAGRPLAGGPPPPPPPTPARPMALRFEAAGRRPAPAPASPPLLLRLRPAPLPAPPRHASRRFSPRAPAARDEPPICPRAACRSLREFRGAAVADEPAAGAGGRAGRGSVAAAGTGGDAGGGAESPQSIALPPPGPLPALLECVSPRLAAARGPAGALPPRLRASLGRGEVRALLAESEARLDRCASARALPPTAPDSSGDDDPPRPRPPPPAPRGGPAPLPALGRGGDPAGDDAGQHRARHGAPRPAPRRVAAADAPQASFEERLSALRRSRAERVRALAPPRRTPPPPPAPSCSLAPPRPGRPGPRCLRGAAVGGGGGAEVPAAALATRVARLEAENGELERRVDGLVLSAVEAAKGWTAQFAYLEKRLGAEAAAKARYREEARRLQHLLHAEAVSRLESRADRARALARLAAERGRVQRQEVPSGAMPAAPGAAGAVAVCGPAEVERLVYVCRLQEELAAARGALEGEREVRYAAELENESLREAAGRAQEAMGELREDLEAARVERECALDEAHRLRAQLAALASRRPRRRPRRPARPGRGERRRRPAAHAAHAAGAAGAGARAAGAGRAVREWVAEAERSPSPVRAAVRISAPSPTATPRSSRVSLCRSSSGLWSGASSCVSGDEGADAASMYLFERGMLTPGAAALPALLVREGRALRGQLAAARSQLAAADEENARLREAIELQERGFMGLRELYLAIEQHLEDALAAAREPRHLYTLLHSALHTFQGVLEANAQIKNTQIHALEARLRDLLGSVEAGLPGPAAPAAPPPDLSDDDALATFSIEI